MKRYSSPSCVKFMSSCNVESQKALKSFSEFGSVAMTSRIFPDPRRLSDFFVFRMGSGQFSPLASSTSSTIISGTFYYLNKFVPSICSNKYLKRLILLDDRLMHHQGGDSHTHCL